jgi:hypothetical protein
MDRRRSKRKIIYRDRTLYEVIENGQSCFVACEGMADGSLRLFRGQTEALSDCSNDQVDRAISVFQEHMRKGGVGTTVIDG